MKVYIKNDDVERGLRKFKKMVAESGLLQEVRDRQEYVKPTTEKKVSHNRAKSRWKKYIASQQLPKKMF